MLITVNVQHDFTSAAMFVAFSADLEALIAKYSDEDADKRAAYQSARTSHDAKLRRHAASAFAPNPAAPAPDALVDGMPNTGAPVYLFEPDTIAPTLPAAAAPAVPTPPDISAGSLDQSAAAAESVEAPSEPAKPRRGRRTNAERAAAAAATAPPAAAETSVPSFPAAQSQGAVKQHAPEAAPSKPELAAMYEGATVPEKLNGEIVGKLGLARLLDTKIPGLSPQASAVTTNQEAVRILKKYGVAKSRFLKDDDCAAALADFIEAATRLAATTA